MLWFSLCCPCQFSPPPPLGRKKFWSCLFRCKSWHRKWGICYISISLVVNLLTHRHCYLMTLKDLKLFVCQDTWLQFNNTSEKAAVWFCCPCQFSVVRVNSLPPPIPDICHRHHRQCLWRKICHVEKISPHDRLSCGEIFHMRNCQLEKCLHMVDMEKYGEKSVFWRNFSTWEMWRQICFVTIHAVLSWNLFYCHIHYFAMKDILSQFTRFCVEKI